MSSVPFQFRSVPIPFRSRSVPIPSHSDSVPFQFRSVLILLRSFRLQDMMQRQTLVPLHYFMRGRDPARTSVLDVACGTGRFLTFLKDNYPAVRTYGVSSMKFDDETV